MAQTKDYAALSAEVVAALGGEDNRLSQGPRLPRSRDSSPVSPNPLVYGVNLPLKRPFAIAIRPTPGQAVAPINGTVVTAMDSGHAFGIRSETGVEVLVHVGIDTVKLDGEHKVGDLAVVVER